MVKLNDIQSNNFSDSSDVYYHYNKSKDKSLFTHVIYDIMLEKKCKNEILRHYILNCSLEEKALATLICLEDNIYLWSKIIDIIKKDDYNIYDIKNVHNKLKKYLIIETNGRSKSGQIHTPYETLAMPMVDLVEDYDEDFWKNPHHKVLDPCGGFGTFLIISIMKFMHGLKKVIPNKEQRYKWIIENCIYFGEIKSESVFLWNMCINPHSKYKTNIYWGSYLDEKFDNHMKNVWDIENFDLIIFNPPFKDSETENKNKLAYNAYDKFTDKSYNISKKIITSTPNKWFGKSSLRKFRNNMINNYGLKYLYKIENNKFYTDFNLKGGICYFLLDKESKSKNVFLNDNLVDLKKYDIIPNDISQTTFDIIEKVIPHKNILHRYNCKSYFGIPTNDKRLTNTGQHKCYVSKSKDYVKYISNVKLENKKVNKWKLIIPAASNHGGMNEEFYSRMVIAKPGELCSETFIFFDFDTLKELNVFKAYMETDMFSYLVRTRKITQDLTTDVFKWVPDINIDRILKEGIRPTENYFRELFNIPLDLDLSIKVNK